MKIITTILSIFLVFMVQLNAKDYVTKKEIKQLQKDYGGRSGERLSNWNNLMKSVRNKPAKVKARKINSYFNQYRYKYDTTVEDGKVLRKGDYWRTFKNFVGQLGGDCDDYALAKYHSLVKLGVPKNKLQLWLGSYRSKKLNHMVLAYYVDNSRDPLILDNNTRTPIKYSKRTNFKPWFYINEKGYGAFKQNIRDPEYKKYPNTAAAHFSKSFGDWLYRMSQE